MDFCQHVSAKNSTWKCNFRAALYSGIWNSLVQVYWLLLLVVPCLTLCHIMTFAVAQCFCVPRRELFWCLQYQGGHYSFLLSINFCTSQSENGHQLISNLTIQYFIKPLLYCSQKIHKEKLGRWHLRIILCFLPFLCETTSTLQRLDWIAAFTTGKNPLRKKMNRTVFTRWVLANL